MSLDASVYADDACDKKVTSARIGSFDSVVRLRESIEEKVPHATVLLTKVLYSASHCGDSLTKDEVRKAKLELEEVAAKMPCPDTQDFIVRFGGIIDAALQHDRPVTF